MPAVGDTYTPHLTVADGDPSTGVLLEVVDGDEQFVLAGLPAPDDLPATGTTWAAPPLTLGGPGQWRLTWTITLGSGDTRTVTQVVDVDPDPTADPGGFSHATTGALVRYSGRPLPPDARRKLVAASAEVDRLTRAARYATDPDTGRAVDPAVARTLADATCELVGWWAETGLESGGRALYTSASIAGVSLGMGGSQQNPQADRIGPKVWSILQTGGLLQPGAVMSD